MDGVISLDIRPDNILVDKGRIYISSWYDKQILVLDETTGEQLHRYDSFDTFEATVRQMNDDGEVIGETKQLRRSRPGAMVLAGDKLFVLQSFAQSILVLHAPTMQPTARIMVTRSEGRLVVAPNKRHVYFACNLERAFYVIDSICFSSRRVSYPENAHGIGALAVAPDGRRLYLGIQRGAREAGADPPAKAAGPANPLKQTFSGPLLAVYDLVAQKYLTIKSIGDTLKARGDDSSLPAAMTFSRDGQLLFVAMGQCMAGVHVFNTESNDLLRPITFASRHRYFRWPGCRDIALQCGKLFVVVGSNNELAIVDEAARRTAKVVELPGGDGPGKLAIRDNRLYVCHSRSRRISVVPVECDDRHYRQNATNRLTDPSAARHRPAATARGVRRSRSRHHRHIPTVRSWRSS
jgi:hypothetical protein